MTALFLPRRVSEPAGERRATLLGVAAVVLWSVSVALARRTSEHLGPLAAGACVYLAAGVFLTVPRLLRRRTLPPAPAPGLAYRLGCGALFLIYTLALFFALALAADRPQAVAVGLLNYLWPALTLLLSLVLLGHRGGWGLIPGTLAALAGVWLVMTQGAAFSWQGFLRQWERNPAAYGLGLLAALAWALYSNLSRRWGGRGDGSVNGFMLTTGAVFLLLHLARGGLFTWDARSLVEVFFLALSTALGYLFWDVAMRRGDMVLVASFSYFTPFLSTLVSSLYLHVALTAGLWAGCLLIIAGSFVSWKSIRPPRAAAAGG